MDEGAEVNNATLAPVAPGEPPPPPQADMIASKNKPEMIRKKLFMKHL